MEAIALRLEAIALRLEAIAIRLEAIALRLKAITIRLEAIALRLEAIAIRLEAIALRLEAIALASQTWKMRQENARATIWSDANRNCFDGADMTSPEPLRLVASLKPCLALIGLAAFNLSMSCLPDFLSHQGSFGCSLEIPCHLDWHVDEASCTPVGSDEHAI